MLPTSRRGIKLPIISPASFVFLELAESVAAWAHRRSGLFVSRKLSDGTR